MPFPQETWVGPSSHVSRIVPSSVLTETPQSLSHFWKARWTSSLRSEVPAGAVSVHAAPAPLWALVPVELTTSPVIRRPATTGHCE
jgi:hypothetical protein